MYSNIPSNKTSLVQKFKEQIEAEFPEFVHVSYVKPTVVYDIWEEPLVSQFMGMVEEKAREEALNEPNFDDIGYISKFFQMVEQDRSLHKTSIHETSDFFKMVENKQESDESNITVKLVTTDYILTKIYKS